MLGSWAHDPVDPGRDCRHRETCQAAMCTDMCIVKLQAEGATSRGLSFCTWTLVTLKPEVQVVTDTHRDGRRGAETAARQTSVNTAAAREGGSRVAPGVPAAMSAAAAAVV
jgi:hypothetical protein